MFRLFADIRHSCFTLSTTSCRANAISVAIQDVHIWLSKYLVKIHCTQFVPKIVRNEFSLHKWPELDAVSQFRLDLLHLYSGKIYFRNIVASTAKGFITRYPSKC